ncbi:MAG TPA: site-specific integrase [Rhizomicrobium sp.]|nr:site-specific integrase [Rhizomicrobium sp.]
MAVRTIKGTWWVDFQFNHTRYRKRSPENSRAGALAYEAVLRKMLARGEDIDRPQQSEMRFEQFAKQWYEEYVVPNNKFSEQRAKGYILRASLIPFFGKTPVGKITSQQIERYKAHQLNTGISKKTLNNRLVVLSKCLGIAYDWLHISTTPPKIERLKYPPGHTKYASPDECSALLKGTRGVLHELIFTALRTGMREGELKGLQWESINWETRTLIVRHSWCDYRKVLDSPKSNRERYVPLDSELCHLLESRKRKSGHVFLDEQGKPLYHGKLEVWLAKACYRVGIRKINWHALRHTFATQLAMRGVPLNVVQSLLGHSSITTTMRYAHVAPSSLRMAIDMLDGNSSGFGQPAVNQWTEAQRMDATRLKAV